MLSQVHYPAVNSELFKDEALQQICHLDYLYRMAGGNQEFTQMMIRLFLKQLPIELKKLELAITSENYKDVKEVSHKLKSSVTMMGASSMEDILKQIEASVTEGVIHQNILVLHNQLVELFNRAATELNLLVVQD
ncbi:Hpt domain-containing protein [Pontibacter vulgaris]|uniref:Hpt domain-containing protein n=1 Tax=Pontibacter vulgaris TaxID=2905679 RepID=UPI001FA748C7|nr:Hpt domain-containing protein [Pontibacter vulgaris]